MADWIKKIYGWLIFYRATFNTLLKVSITRILFDRLGLSLSLFMSILDALWTLTVLHILYMYIDKINNWRFEESLIATGFFFMFSGIVEMIVHPSINFLAKSVRDGTILYLLTKPLPVFVYTIAYYKIEKLSKCIIGLLIVLLCLDILKIKLYLVSVITLMFSIIISVLMVYSIFFIIANFYVLALDGDKVEELFLGIIRVARFPVQLFPEPVRSIFYFILPFAFIGTVPAEILLNRFDSQLILYALTVTLILLATNVRLFNVILKNYINR